MRGVLPETSKPILITGANGFVGSHLTEALLARGYRVRCMVRRTSNLAFIRDLPVEWTYADFANGDSLRQACRGVHAVCHCAALTRALDAPTFFKVNTQGTVALARACAEENPGLERFLFVSSHAAAGPSRTSDEYIDESCPPRPVTWYGQSKLAAEEALADMAEQLRVTILRPSAAFGPRDKDFLSYFAGVEKGFRVLPGRGDQMVSLIYVRDLVDAVFLALQSERAANQTYFICGRAISYGEIASAIARVLGRRTMRIAVPEAVLGLIAFWARIQGRLTGKPALLNDQRIRDLRQPYWLCSGEKAQRELGFVAESDLDAAIRETADWYLENGWL